MDQGFLDVFLGAADYNYVKELFLELVDLNPLKENQLRSLVCKQMLVQRFCSKFLNKSKCRLVMLTTKKTYSTLAPISKTKNDSDRSRTVPSRLSRFFTPACSWLIPVFNAITQLRKVAETKIKFLTHGKKSISKITSASKLISCYQQETKTLPISDQKMH